MNGSSKEAFYACCREAFYAWWKKEADGFIGFVDQEDAAFHAWVAALEWYGVQLHKLEALKQGPQPEDPAIQLAKWILLRDGWHLVEPRTTAQSKSDYEKLKDNYRNLCEWPVPGDPTPADQSDIQEL